MFDEIVERVETNTTVLKQEFSKLEGERADLTERCEKYAGWTLPYEFPLDQLSSNEEFQYDYQSVGAQAVVNLANKLVMALFPPGRPFFKLQLSPNERTDVMASTGMNSVEIDASLSKVEQEVQREFDKSDCRPSAYEIAKLLIITGSCVYHKESPEEDGVVYNLRDFVLRRDLRGNVVTCIIREKIAVAALSPEMQELVRATKELKEAEEVTLYTGIERVEDDMFVVTQELEDICHCEKQVGVYTKEVLPWHFLYWELPPRKDYGVGLVEAYSGDFHSLSTLAEAGLDFITILTDLKILVNPTGSTNIADINATPSGGACAGREEDIHVLSHNVAANSSYLENRFNTIERRIASAFLLNTRVTRDAERVTAEEIRQQAVELETSLGGVYSRQAQVWQAPLAKVFLTALDESLRGMQPTIVTGMDALSRYSELQRLREFVADIVGLKDLPEHVQIALKSDDLIKAFGANHGIDAEQYVRTPEEQERERDKKIEEQRRLNAAQNPEQGVM